MFFIGPVRNFYSRFERPISSFSLLAGFIFDALTLKRVDALWENLWIAGYLVLIGACIILVHVRERKEDSEENPGRAHFWYVNILQFAFGGIFSAFLILYFRSADILVAWPFVVLLAATFIANEFLKRHYLRLGFQISLFFLSIYLFAIFLVPILTRHIGALTFLLSGIISLGAIALFLQLLFRFSKNDFTESKKLTIFLIAIIFILINFLYFTNLIPPIPLSLKDGGVYHSVQKTQAGNYQVAYEDHGWRGYFELYPDFRAPSGSPVYAFSAIFSPRNFNFTILHEWQRYNEAEEKWVTERVISLPVVGGRDGGFRTYSVRENLTPGKWRVNIKTEQGSLIGRLRFELLKVSLEPTLKTMVK